MEDLIKCYSDFFPVVEGNLYEADLSLCHLLVGTLAMKRLQYQRHIRIDIPPRQQSPQFSCKYIKKIEGRTPETLTGPKDKFEDEMR